MPTKKKTTKKEAVIEDLGNPTTPEKPKVTAKHVLPGGARYEPQRVYDWQFKVSDRQLEMIVSRTSRPQPVRGEQKIESLFREMTDVDVLGKLIEWRDGRNGREVQLQLLDPQGRVVEIWHSLGLKIQKIDTNVKPLDYAENEIGYIGVTFVGRFTRLRVM